jgi:NAD(P)-dependent dehydrogenase (short-subunit alcohol dehydrogenase family)
VAHSGIRPGKFLATGALLAAAVAVRGAVSRREETDLRGKVVLITGGSRGLGLALSEELGAKGCRIAICARDPEELEKAAQILSSRGVEVFMTLCDVTDRDEVARLLREVTDHYGSIDVLIANAGIMNVAPVEVLTAEDFDRVMAVNFEGVLNVTLGVLPQMERQGGGRIAVITSIGGKVPLPHMLPYTSAKFAAAGFAAGLRAELSGTGITVTTVYPGLMRTGSYLQAEFGGDQAEEFDWFSLGASSPYPVTTSAPRAARIITGAIQRGDAECIFPVTALLAARASALFPAATSALLATVNGFLPSARMAPGQQRFVKGAHVQEAAPNPVRDAATVLGQRAAEQLNQGV